MARQDEITADRGALDAPRLYVGEQEAELELYRAAGGHVAVSTVADAGKPGSNQDSAALVPVAGERLVLIVADGVGGQPGARGASNLSVQILCEALAQVEDGSERLRSTILDGIEAANRAVLGLGSGAATTLALAEVGPGYVRTYHVGDSVILLCGQRGLLKLQTIPHSPVGFAVEAGLLDADEALHHAELNIISNVIGSPDMRIEIGSETPMAPRDTLLLASDGLFDNLLQEEIIGTIRKGGLGGAIHQLTGLAQARMRGAGSGLPSKPDDFTAVLFRRQASR